MNIDKLLDRLYNEPDLDKRRYIPDKLAKLGDWQSTKPLGELIIDQNQPTIMRNEAVESLGKQGDPDAVQYLKQVLDDPDDEIRRTAVWSLGQVGTPNTLEIIFNMKNDPNDQVRRWVAKSAGRVRNDAVILYLQDYVKEIDFVEDHQILADIIRAVSSQINRAELTQLNFWTELCYEILTDQNIQRYVKQAAILLLLSGFERGIEPKIDLILKMLHQIPKSDPLLRPGLILALGHGKEIEVLKNLEDHKALEAIGIAGDFHYLQKLLKEPVIEDKKVVAILTGFEYGGFIPDNLEKFISSDNLTIQLKGLKLHAMSNRSITPLLAQYEAQKGKYTLIDLFKYYGKQALEIYETSAFSEDKVERQNTVYALNSPEMLENPQNHDRIKQILEKVDKNDRIWHIRRDARIGIEKINKL